MEARLLGKVYKDTEVIIKQGEPGNCMYVIQDGLVEVVFTKVPQVYIIR